LKEKVADIWHTLIRHKASECPRIPFPGIRNEAPPQVPEKTVSRRCYEVDINKRRARGVTKLEDGDARRRLAWCKDHNDLTENDYLSFVWGGDTYVRRMEGASRGQEWVFRHGPSTADKFWTPETKAYHYASVYAKGKQHIQKVSVHMWRSFAGQRIAPLSEQQGRRAKNLHKYIVLWVVEFCDMPTHYDRHAYALLLDSVACNSWRCE